ncbi:hypothetical protein H1C71_016730, partial [Ictidomys tridecemlineatus]
DSYSKPSSDTRTQRSDHRTPDITSLFRLLCAFPYVEISNGFLLLCQAISLHFFKIFSGILRAQRVEIGMLFISISRILGKKSPQNNKTKTTCSFFEHRLRL